MGLYDFTVYDMICRSADANPDRDAVIFNDARLNYRTFKEKCDQLAAGLVAAGVQKGDRLGVVAHNCDEYLILYGAAAKIGAIILAVNWRFQEEEIFFVLNDCAPRFIFSGQPYCELVSKVASRVKSIEKRYAMGPGDLPADCLPFSSLYKIQDADRTFDIAADAGFVIIHTAAVEGEPRGALLSQANIVFGSMVTLLRYHLTEKDCHICILPLFHIAGLALTMAVLHCGGKNVILERFNPDQALAAIEKENGTTFFNFAPILKKLMDAYDKGAYDISSLRHITGMDHPENIMRFLELAPSAKYETGFGQTEAMGVSGGLIADRPGSAGKATPLSCIELFDDQDRTVATGTPGEICVRSPTVFLGYWGRDGDNAYTFSSGWHHTGDIGRFDEDGFLWYVKRKAQKELIKPGGENVYPAEVEKVIISHGAVAEVSVIGVSDKQWGEAIKAVCVLKPGQAVQAGELREFVASRIARYKKPKHVVFVKALPKTEDNEIDREKVKKEHGAKY
ncbi:MAG: AMP-binding protein [Deltaproteobacteria bacterium]|nr:AMP-binding protein [Deltaproteobacteria bacterium]